MFRRGIPKGWGNLASAFAAAFVVALAIVAVPLAMPAAAAAPTPTIYTATNLSNTSATLNGYVNPAGASTALTFCYSASSITISGGNCTVSSGTIGYATATQSPSSSSSPITFSASATGLSAGTKYYYAAGATQTATSWSTTTTFTTMTGGPFACMPAFYQENSGYLWSFDATTGTYVKINSAAQAESLNGIGYDTNNNYIYGVGGSTIYQVGSDGNETEIGTPTNIISNTGDFLPGTNFLLTEDPTTGDFYLEDVMSTSAASVVKPASVILGTTSGSVMFAAYDIAMKLSGSNYVGYGLAMTSGSNPATGTLYKAVIPVSVITANDNSSTWSGTIANAVTVTSLTGIVFPSAERPANTDDFGAAYGDSAGDAFFYANTEEDLYEATAAQLATGSAFTVSYEAPGTGLATGTNDGADCPNASSPFSPPTPENDSYTVVTANTLTVSATQGPSLLSNDQIVSGAAVTMGATTLEPGGPGQTSYTFSSTKTSHSLTGANGTLDVTNAGEGYFTFTPDAGFTGTETFTYYLVETAPYELTSLTAATVSIDVLQQQVVTWSTPTILSANQSSATPNPATDLGGVPITYSVVTTDTNTAGCSVNATSGVITYLGTGQCTIQAAATATSLFSAASAGLTFTVATVLTNVSWDVSNSQTGDAAVTYAYSFTTATAGTLTAVTMTVPTGTAGTVTAETVYGLPAGTVTFGSNTLTYTITTPVSVGAGVPIYVSFSGITNTATAGTYTSEVTTNVTGGILDAATTNSVVFGQSSTNVNLNIGETLTFTNSTSTFALTIDPVMQNKAESQVVILTVQTNATNGYSLAASDSGLSRKVPPFTIPAVSTGPTVGVATFPASGFGASATLTTGGTDGAALAAGFSGGDFVGYPVTAANFLTSTGPTGTTVDTLTLLNQVAVNYTVPDGSYSDTITYLVTPNY
ncbi:MAG: Ig-like domain-containing protein [Acidimicrobiales bacterium]|jgi:hypothetical protein